MATRIIVFTFFLIGQSRCFFCIFKVVLVSRKFHARNRVFCPAAPKAVFLVSQSGSVLTVPQSPEFAWPGCIPMVLQERRKGSGDRAQGDTREQSFIQVCTHYMMLNKWVWLSLVSYESQKWKSVLHSKSLAETGGKKLTSTSSINAGKKNSYLATDTNTSNVMLLKYFPLSGWITEKDRMRWTFWISNYRIPRNHVWIA